MCTLKSVVPLFLNIILLVSSKTVRYTLTPNTASENFNDLTTKSYELQVPGSDLPEEYTSAFKNARKFKLGDTLKDLFTTQKTSLNEPTTNKCYGIGCTAYDVVDDEIAGSKLNSFIKKYAGDYGDDWQKEPLVMEKVDLIQPRKQQPEKEFGAEEKGYSGVENNQGWVTLEAVPWSKSKISKWQSNVRPNRWPDTGDSKPWFNRPSYDDRPNYDRPYKPSYADDRYYEQESNQDYNFEIPQRPHFEPDYPYGSKSPWNYDNRNPSSHKHFGDNKDCNRQHNDIITDGRPGNFPVQSIGFIPYNEAYRRPTPVVYADLVSSNSPSLVSEHPPTHPLTGDGQWVLLSTTKGYQYPKKRQRSLEINPAVLSARKSVQLTVLPPLKGSDVNMTTSHGGLLQVDAAFETVDDARKMYIRKLKNHNNTKTLFKLNQPKPQPVSNAPDTTAVLAAVGAGMVPATMAMVVPMVLGRKRRSTDNVYPELHLTHLPSYQLEPTIQRRNM